MVDETGDRIEVAYDKGDGAHFGLPKDLDPIIQANNSAEQVRLPGLGIIDESKIHITLPFRGDSSEKTRLFSVDTTQNGETEFKVSVLSPKRELGRVMEREGNLLVELQVPPEPMGGEAADDTGLPRPATTEEISEAFAVATQALEEARTAGDLEQVDKHQRLVGKLKAALATAPNK